MLLKKLLASLAFATIVITGFFGTCSIQHLPAHDHHMEHGFMLSGGTDNGTCPLAPVADFNLNQKFSQADTRSFGLVDPVGIQNLVSLNSILPSQIMQLPLLGFELRKTGELPVSITSPPLAKALSQGILNPKIDA